MRMPWTKTKGEQLDLLDFMPAAESPSALSPSPNRPRAGQTLLVASSALDEDPGNPRTELPDTELAELADDIRQRGILQPIVVRPPDGRGRYQIQFGARRWRAAQLAGLDQVPVVVRDVPADPYDQVAENQKRQGLTSLDLARFIRGRIDSGESNSDVARRLGMNLTTVAHHLSLLDLPQALDDALKSGRCTSPRTLHELRALHADNPGQVRVLLAGGAEITRATVSAVRSTPGKSFADANAACDRLERALSRIEPPNASTIATVDLIALRARVERIATRWLQGSDRQTPSQTER